MSSENQKAEAAAKLQALRDDYARRLPEKLDSIEREWQQLLFVSWSVNGLKTLLNSVHQLAGSAGSFGQSELGVLARRIEEQLRLLDGAGSPPTSEKRSQLSALLARLKQTVSAPTVAKVAVDVSSSVSGKTIYLVDDDPELASYMQLELIGAGYSVRHFRSPAGFKAAIAEQTPDAVVMDISFPEGELAGVHAALGMRSETGYRVPLVFISARTDMDARLQAARAGGSGYLTKPIDMAMLRRTLASLTHSTEETTNHVLIVDDDTELAEHYAALLRQAGIQARTLAHPLRALEYIAEARPSMVLLDLNMPGCSGLELATVLRQERALAGLPIVFVSGLADAKTQQAAWQVGGDDYLIKPVADADLVTAVRRQLQRARRSSVDWQASCRESAPGLMTVREFLGELDVAVATAIGAQAEHGLVVMTIANYPELRDTLDLGAMEKFLEHVSSVLLREGGHHVRCAALNDGTFALLVEAQDQSLVDVLTSHVSGCFAGLPFMHNRNPIYPVLRYASTIINKSTSGSLETLTALWRKCLPPSTETTQSAGVSPPATPVRGGPSEGEVVDAIAARKLRLVYQGMNGRSDDDDYLYEVRVRLSVREGNEVSTGVFFPIARESGRLVEIDRWVVEHAFSDLAEDSSLLYRARCLIKVSGEAVSNRLFTSFVSAAFNNARVRRRNAVLFEVDAPSVLAHFNDAVRFVSEIRAIGCGFVLDTFGGTAHGSEMMARLKPDYLKLDGAITQKIATDLQARSKIVMLIEAAHRNGVKVIASCVESEDMSQIWRDLEIDHIHGYVVQQPSESLARCLDRRHE